MRPLDYRRQTGLPDAYIEALPTTVSMVSSMWVCTPKVKQGWPSPDYYEQPSWARTNCTNSSGVKAANLSNRHGAELVLLGRIMWRLSLMNGLRTPAFRGSLNGCFPGRLGHFRVPAYFTRCEPQLAEAALACFRRSSATSTIMSSWPPTIRRRPSSTKMSTVFSPYRSAATSECRRKLL